MRVVIGLAVLGVILALPSTPSRLDFGALLQLPVELTVVALLLMVLRGRALRLFIGAVVLAAAALTFLKIADLGTFTAFQRPFNPLLDATILVAGWHLLSGTIGQAEALLAVTIGLLGWVSAIALLGWGLQGAAHMTTGARRRSAVAATALTAVGFVGLLVERSTALDLPVAASNIPSAIERVAVMRRSVTDLVAFETQLADDPVAGISEDDLFTALAGKDVYILFVESYGRSVIEDPAYRTATRQRLKRVEDELRRAGMATRSGWLKSPTSGGQSWLAHGALLSGLWTADQSRYDRMIASERATLNALFQRAGWTTLAVMPAITMDWPEAAYFGYDAVYAAADLGYRGKPFNWVTMPDQFTLEATRRLIAAEDDPVMVEAALISSHAPWTPVPTMVPWTSVGNGTIFNEQAASGDPPSIVWANPERVRDQYVLSIDYALEVLGSYMATFGKNAVFVVLGDHQPASIVTGPDASRDVPIHIVSDDASIVNRFAALGWTAGMIPSPDAIGRPMDTFRESFVRLTSRPEADEDSVAAEIRPPARLTDPD